jgi:hypothetical protein
MQSEPDTEMESEKLGMERGKKGGDARDFHYLPGGRAEKHL